MGESPTVPLVVEAYLDSEALQQGLREIDSGATKLSRKFQSMTQSLQRWAVRGTAFVGAIAYTSIQAARQVEVAGRKFEAVFRGQSEAVRDWSKGLGETFALNQSDMEMWLATAQDLFVPMGMARDEAAELSKQVLDLTTRLAVFNGQPTAQTLSNIMSGLVGITRSVRQYGILINDTMLKERALRLGIIGTNEELTEQQKVLMRLGIMQESSTDAMAKAAGMMDGMEGNARRLGLAVHQLREEFGKALAPVLADLAEDVVPMLKNWGEWISENRTLIASFVSLMPKLAAATIAINATTKSVGALAVALAGARAAAAGPIAGGIAAAGIGGYAMGSWAMKQFETLERMDVDRQFAQQIYEQSPEFRQTGKQTEALLKKRAQERLQRMRQYVQAQKQELGGLVEDLRDKIRGEFQVGEALEQALREAISRAADSEELKRFQDRLAAVDTRGSPQVFAAFERLAEVAQERITTLELQAQKEAEDERIHLRVNAWDRWAELIAERAFDTAQMEVRQLQSVMAQHVQLRRAALQEIENLARESTQRMFAHEQTLWDLRMRDPAMTSEEKWDAARERVGELMEQAESRMLAGQTDFARQLLDRARQLAGTLAREGETWDFDFGLQAAEKALGQIEDLTVQVTETEQTAAREAAEVAEEAYANAAEKIKVKLEGLGEMHSRLAEKLETLKIELKGVDVAEEGLKSLSSRVEALSRQLEGLRSGFEQSSFKLDVQIDGDLSDEAAQVLGERIQEVGRRTGTEG